jgi:riboflavin transporter FmnP
MWLIDWIVKNWLQTASPALAADVGPVDYRQPKLVILIRAFLDLITDIQDIVLGVAGSIVALMIIIGGIQYISGQADSGKKTITAAVIGTVIILMASAIVATLNYLAAAPKA